MAGIQLIGVSKRFGDATVVRDATFTIEDGEFFILVGPSGCGKSTLLNMIVGLDDVTEGEIRVDGERVNGLDPKDRNMAMVFQSYAIYPHMSVRENMAFPLKLAKRPQAEVEARVVETARSLEIEDLLDRRPGELSGGQRQRVAMGRALVREPKVFLLDEPLSNLDAKLRVQMRTEIARLQRRLGTTTVYVTHDQTEAMTLGDRIAIMRGGEIQQIGTPRELYDQPANLFVAGFIGSPAMNFLPARWQGGRLETPLGAITLPQERERDLFDGQDRLIIGFRADHLRIAAEGEQAGEGGICFEVQADVVEWLGSDLFVYFDVPLEGFDTTGMPEARSLCARIDPAAGVTEGDRVRLCLAAAHVHLFAGDRVGPP